MPTIQYVCGSDIHTKQIPTPKSVSRAVAWYRAAQKVLKDVMPYMRDLGVQNEAGWICYHHEVDIKWLKFLLEGPNGQKAVLVILR